MRAIRPMALAVLGLAGAVFTAGAADDVGADDGILEVVFRRMLPEKPAKSVFFLAIGAKKQDPSDALLKRLRKDFPNAKKISEAELKAGAYLEKKTGRNGTLLTVTKVERLGKAKMKVHATAYAGPLAGSGMIYTLVLKNGKWTVGDEELDWIS